MIIVCPRCGLLYAVGSAEIGEDPRAVRCSGCEWQWLQSPAETLPDDDEALRLLALRLNGGVVKVEPEAAAPRMTRRTGAAKVAAPPVARRAPNPAPASATAPVSARGKQPIAEHAPTTQPEPEEPFDEKSEVALDEAAAQDSACEAALAESLAEENESEAAAPAQAAAEIEPAAEHGGDDDDEAPGDRSEELVAAKALHPRAGADDHAIPRAPADAFSRKVDAGEVRRYKRPPTAVLAGGAIAATLLVTAGLLAATRGPIISTFPGAAGLYRAAGFSVPHDFAEGLEIRDVISSRSWGDDGQILTVEGDLANVAAQPRNLPMVRVVLVDGADAEIQEVVVPPPSETLPVGETIRFEARINNPAETAKRIKVSLAPPPEPS